MPDLTAPLLSLGASGTIAKTLTYSSWRGIKYARQRVIPANPKSTNQTKVRNVFANLNRWWLYMPTYALQSYTDFASGKPLTNRNAWIQKNASALYSGAALTNTQFYAASGGAPAATIASVTPGSGTLTPNFNTPTTPSGWTIVRAVAAALHSGDPTTLLTTTIVEATDATSPYSPVLSGLTSGIVYDLQGAFLWTKPDGSPAWGISTTTTGTPS